MAGDSLVYSPLALECDAEVVVGRVVVLLQPDSRFMTCHGVVQPAPGLEGDADSVVDPRTGQGWRLFFGSASCLFFGSACGSCLRSAAFRARAQLSSAAAR